MENLKLILALSITCLFFFYMILDFIKEKNRNKKYRLEREEQKILYQNINKQLVENSLVNLEILDYLKITTQKYIEEITESQARIVIESILNNSQYAIYEYMAKIMKENHIKGNEKEITSKVKLFISNKFHKDSLLLKEFKYKEKYLGDYPLNNFKENLTEGILNSVLKEKGEYVLYCTLQNNYDSIKNDMLEKTLD